MAREGHERCIPLEQYQKLQELHENQKKLIAKLQEDVRHYKELWEDLNKEIAQEREDE